MVKNEKELKPSKKVRRRKSPESLDRRKDSKDIGRPKLTDKIKEEGLTNEMRDFAYYVSLGHDPKEVGDILELSDYMIKNFMSIPEVQEEIEAQRQGKILKEREIIEREDFRATIAMIRSLKRLADKGKLPASEMTKYVGKKKVALGLESLGEDTKMTATRKITSKNKPRGQLPAGKNVPFVPEDKPDDEIVFGKDEEETKIEEQSVSLEKSTK